MAAALFIDKPETLTALEEKGIRAANFFHRNGEVETDRSLTTNPAFRFVVDKLAQDMGDFQLEERTRVKDGVWKYAESLKPQLLISEDNRLDLVGVALRPDRKLFQIQGCGEVRLIFRLLSLDRRPKYRFPILAILELPLPDQTQCKDVWAKYAQSFQTDNVEQLATDIQSLSAAQSYLWRWNVQFLRVPQRKKSKDLQRNAYLLRSFRVNPDGKASVMKLENTVDIPHMTEAMKKSLWQWITTNRKAIDSGVFLIPEEFLAERSVITTPYSSFRNSNFPLDQLFEDAKFDLATPDKTWDKARTLRRLGNASCQGCHGIRSVAGFHFLGINRDLNVYTVKYAYSNHFQEQQAYRQSFLDDKVLPQYFPFADRGITSAGDEGEHCGLDQSFADWTCRTGYRCSGEYPRRMGAKIGVCVAATNFGVPGDACDAEEIMTTPQAGFDKVMKTEEQTCIARKCAKSLNGFPAGACMSTCNDQDKFPDAECITGVRAKDFSPCLREGRSIAECRRVSAQQTLYRACNATRLCRDDYVCMQIEDRLNGACVPPYVLEEMTLLGR